MSTHSVWWAGPYQDGTSEPQDRHPGRSRRQPLISRIPITVRGQVAGKPARVPAVLFWNNPFGNSCRKRAERHFLSRWLARLPNTSGMVLPAGHRRVLPQDRERAARGRRRGRRRRVGTRRRDRPARPPRRRPCAARRARGGPGVPGDADRSDRRGRGPAPAAQLRSRANGLRQALLPGRPARPAPLPPRAQVDGAGARDPRRADRCRGPGAGGRARRAQLSRRPPSSPGPPSTAPAAHV